MGRSPAPSLIAAEADEAAVLAPRNFTFANPEPAEQGARATCQLHAAATNLMRVMWLVKHHSELKDFHQIIKLIGTTRETMLKNSRSVDALEYCQHHGETPGHAAGLCRQDDLDAAIEKSGGSNSDRRTSLKHYESSHSALMPVFTTSAKERCVDDEDNDHNAETQDQILRQIAIMESEHGDLDAVIERLGEDLPFDQLKLQRLKKTQAF